MVKLSNFAFFSSDYAGKTLIEIDVLDQMVLSQETCGMLISLG